MTNGVQWFESARVVQTDRAEMLPPKREVVQTHLHETYGPPRSSYPGYSAELRVELNLILSGETTAVVVQRW